MPVYNLASKFAGKMEKQWLHDSFVKPYTNGELEFSGVDTVQVYVPTTVPLNDYQREGTARYGDPKEIVPNVHRYQMKQDKSYTGTIDLGNSRSRTIGAATGEWVKNQNSEVVIPFEDRYALNVYAQNGRVVELGASASLTKDTAIAELEKARAAFVNGRVPVENRVVWATSAFTGLVAESKQFTEIEKLAVSAVRKGEIGQCKTFRVIEVPDDLMPAGCQFICAHKSALVQADKITELKVNTSPQGISGTLIEARNLFDAFVIGSLAKGVYALVGNGTKQACSVAISAHQATVTAADAQEIYYTLDGSDPRFSQSRKIVATGGKVTTETGQTIRVVAYGAAGKFTSDIAEDTDDGE